MLEKIKQSLSKKAVDVYVDENVDENVDEDVDVDVDDDDDDDDDVDVLIRGGGEEDDDKRGQNFGEQNKRKVNRKVTPKMNPVRKKLSCYKICIALRRCIFDFNERKIQNSIRGNMRISVRLKRKIQICNIEQHTDDNIMKKQVCQIAQSAAKNMLKQSEIATNFLEICCLQKICPVDKFAIINMGVDIIWTKLWINKMDENRKIQSGMIPKSTSVKYSMTMLIAE